MVPGEEEASPLVRDKEDELIPVPIKENEILTEDTDLLLQGARIDVTPTEGVTTQWPEELRAATQRLSEASTSVVPQELEWSAVVNHEEAFCTTVQERLRRVVPCTHLPNMVLNGLPRSKL